MKLSYVVLLALVAVAAADSSNYYQTGHSEEGVELAQPSDASPSNDFYKRRRSSRQQQGLTGVLKKLFGLGGANRRQAFTGTGFTGTGGGFNGGGGFGNGGFGGGGFGGGGFGAAPIVVAPATTGGITAGSLAPFILIGLLFGIAAVLGALAFSAIDFNSSGRGLDTDEWEVDHSVWMNQLQKDFEDSWSTE